MVLFKLDLVWKCGGWFCHEINDLFDYLDSSTLPSARASLHAHDVAEVAVLAVQDGGEDEELGLVGVGVVHGRDGVDPAAGQLGRFAIFLKQITT